MVQPTRTVNPLHFEDFEPHRFEDLIRQLAYDFRVWKSIEGTGRSGSDEGMDIRAIELADSLREDEPIDGDPDSVGPEPTERLWVIQCKREQVIRPARMRTILLDTLPTGNGVPYGFILAAACDFSKATRDLFSDQLRRLGIQEWYPWGKSVCVLQYFATGSSPLTEDKPSLPPHY